MSTSLSDNQFKGERRGKGEGNWGYNPADLLGILSKSPSNSKPPKKSKSSYYKAFKNMSDESLIFKITSEKMNTLEGKYREFTLEYLKCLFEETLSRYRKVWEKQDKFSKNEQTIIENCREYYVEAMTREWNWLMEVWENKSKINAEDVLIIHDKLKELGEPIEDAAKNKEDGRECNILYKNHNFGKSAAGCPKHLGTSSEIDTCSEAGMAKYSEKDALYGGDCWKTAIQRVQKHIAIQPQRFGNIFVPKICKVRLPCGQNEYFSDLEIGLDSEGQPVAVKHVKRTFCTSAMADTWQLRHLHVLTSYLSPGPNSVLATPLMNSNLGQFVMYLKSSHQLAAKAFTVVHQMIHGLLFLQSREPPIIHGNLKPTNVFVDNNGLVKIAEFGLNLTLPNAPPSSLIWRAPEQVQSHQRGEQCLASLAADVASAGMLIYFVLSGGRHPCGDTVGEILVNMAEGDTEVTVGDATARHLMTSMMVSKEERCDIFEVSRHIYWWPTEERWRLVAACAKLDSTSNRMGNTSNNLYAFLYQVTENLVIGDDKAILCSKGGAKETQKDMSEFLWLARNFPVPLDYIEKRLPNLPLYLYQVLHSTPWAKSPQLHIFFETDYFKIQSARCLGSLLPLKE